MQVVCGDLHSLFLTYLGEILSCGANHQGQLGLSHNQPVTTISKVSERQSMLSMYLVQISTPSEVFVKVVAGRVRSAGLTREGRIFEWGETTPSVIVVNPR